jgi:nucleoside phosphorylase
MSAERGTQSAESGVTKVLVCFALEEEAKPFRRVAPANPKIKTLVTGVGKGNARRAICDALKLEMVGLVVTCGFAGGLNPDLKMGAVVFSAGDSGLTAALQKLGAKPVRFHCADRIATTATEKEELWRKTGADAVEMESQVIAAVCDEQDVRCATVRVILDTADEDLPLDFNRLSNADLSLNYGKLVLAVARSPGKISALMRLQKNSKFAAKRLADVLAKLI